MWVKDLRLKVLFFSLKSIFLIHSFLGLLLFQPSLMDGSLSTQSDLVRVLSQRPWVKHKRRRGNSDDFHLSGEELFLLLTSKRMKAAIEDTGGVSVKSQNLNRGGDATHFFKVCLGSLRNFSKRLPNDLEKCHNNLLICCCCLGF